MNYLDRDRFVILIALFGVVALAWSYLATMPSGQSAMSMDAGAMAAMPAQPWDISYFVATCAMWVIMMVGMMVPSAAPTVLLFAALQRQIDPVRPRLYRRIALFVTGYVVAWGVFSIVATASQWALSAALLLSPMTTRAGPVLGGLLLVAAAAYQFTPLKTACLRHCRNPAAFLVSHRRTGKLGPLVIGMEHGIYCIGCCWALMALLFVFGVMNLLWVAVIAVFVFIEKVLPAGVPIGRVSAALMCCTGIFLIAYG